MTLAINGRLIASLSKNLGEDLLIPVETIAVVHEAILVAVLPGQNNGSARSANRVRAEAFLEKHALIGELIDVGSWIDRLQPAVVGANRMGCVIITKDKEDVGSFVLSVD